MADPTEWGAVPVDEGPRAWGAVPVEPSTNAQEEQPEIPEAFLDRINRGQEYSDIVKQTGDPFEAAAERTRRSVMGERPKSLATILPEMMATSLLYGVSVGPILAAKRLGEQTTAGTLDVTDPEAINDALSVTGMITGTRFARVALDRAGGVSHEPIGEFPNAQDFRTAAQALNPQDRIAAIEPEIAGNGQVNFRVGDERGLFATVKDGRLVVDAASVPEEMRGQGLGVSLYERAIAWANERGLEFASDDTVSGSAAKVYEALARRGYEVVKSPTASETYKGAISTEGGPAFIVRPKDSGTAVEQNLRDLWEERGIHPAEAVHDADSDAFLKADLTHPNPEPRDRSGIPPVQSSPVAEGTPRTELAKTGEAHIDAVLDSEVTNRNIDNPVINDSYDVPYSAGGSTPLADPTVYIDRHFPRSMTIDGVTFDPVDPFTIHENIEQHVMDLLMNGTSEPTVAPGMVRMYHGGDPQDFKGPLWFSSSRKYAQGYREDASLWYVDIPEDHPIIEPEYPEQSVKRGFTFNRELPEELAKNRQLLAMDSGTAYKVAHHEWAEKAEGAWYKAHGIDQAKAEEAYRPFIDQIEHENPVNPPPNLYEKPYPHQDIRSAKGETGPVPEPTAEEIARAKEIVARATESGELRPAVGGAEQAMARAISEESGRIPITNNEGKQIGVFSIELRSRGGGTERAIQVRGVQIDASERGKGYGIDAYQKLADYALSTGRELWSDRTVEPEAIRVYEALRRRGYTVVEQDPNATPFDAHFKVTAGPEGGPMAAGADITRPENLPTLDEQSPPRAGGLVAAMKDAGAKLLDIGDNIQMLVTPMAARKATPQARAIAKDFNNAKRRNEWESQRIDQDIARRFTPEQRKRMWDAADEESVLRQEGKTSEHMGLATLEPAERAAVEDLQARSQLAWAQARDLGMVEGDGLPAYTPRMVINVAEAGGDQRALPLNVIGQNLRTRTSQMLRREHLTAEETEAAAKAKLGEGAEIARDIRALPLATAKLEDAIAGRTLINAIEEAGRRTGDETVSVGSNPGKGWFTIDHPAFKKWQPKFETVDGATQAARDANGNIIFQQVPIYVRGDFEGPLRSVLTQLSGAAYGALMSLKGKTMGLIMNSPLIHNAVEWGRALPAMPGKVATFRVYFDGNRAKNDPVVMRDAIDAGLVPIGKRFFNQDITSIMEEPNLAPGRSWTAQVLGFIPDLFDQAAGDAVKASIDKAGDFWHNTLLWDRVGDLQMGLYANFRDSLTAKGVDRLTASRAAAHWANRYAGALPEEAMSANARKISNLLLFSRSFTLGNIGAMKDMFTGLPKDVMAQIERDGGMLDPKAVRSIAVRKAIAVVTLDMGLMYVMNSLLQNGFNILAQDSTLDKEMRGYAERFKGEMSAIGEHPLKLLQPLSVIQSLSATAENEPGKDERVRVGYANDGTAIYMRNPAGKIGEEFTGYLSGPLDMIHRKLGTIARPIWQIMANDKGFGRKVYDPSADAPAKYLGNMGAIAKHLAMSQLPEGQIGAFMDLVKGDGDPKVNVAQAFGPVAGVTFSKGAPGGPAVGELYQAHAMHNYAVDAALPDIRKQIQRGDVDGARDRMTELGIAPGLQRFYIRTSIDPATRLGGRTLRDFYLYGTPEQKQRLENAR